MTDATPHAVASSSASCSACHSLGMRCVREVGQRLQVSVEHASPAHFIPLPSNHAQRHVYVGRFEQLDVFHFDFYSIALSKLYRGNEKDLEDVQGMVEEGVIALPLLRTHLDEVATQIEQQSFEDTVTDFRHTFAVLVERLGAS